MRPLAALLLLVGCTGSRSAERTTHAVEQIVTLGEVHRVEERREEHGAVVVRVTVEEFAPGGIVQSAAQDPGVAGNVGANPTPAPGALVRRTVREERREPVVTTERATEASTSSTSVNTDATTQEQTKVKASAGPPWFVWVMGVCALAAAAYLAARRGMP